MKARLRSRLARAARATRAAVPALAALAAIVALLLVALGTAGAAGKPFDPNAPKKPGGDANAPKPKITPNVPKLARRVVLISLDGASAEALQQLWRDDELDEGGFARFFREGQVAESLTPVNPTVTAANHVSLATGAAPALTGIVGNSFHAAGTTEAAVASGFSFPIATETLWEAARRQGKYAAVMMWPTADDTVVRRGGDLGTTWPSAAGARRPHDVLVLHKGDWQPAPEGTQQALKLDSNLPLLTAHLTFKGAKTGDDAGIDLYAGSTGRAGGKAGAVYDTVVAVSSPEALAAARSSASTAKKPAADKLAAAAPPAAAAKKPAPPAIPAVQSLVQSLPLHLGDWAQLVLHEGPVSSRCWIKVLTLDPGLETARVYFGGSYRTTAYPPEFGADLAESNVEWPGVPDDQRLLAGWREEPGNDQWIDVDTWVEQADHLAGYLGDTMRVAIDRGDWHVLLGYFPVIDEAGHRLLLSDPHQAGYSDARRDEYARARLKVWRAVDRELRLLLAAVDLGRTTVVVVSDHGMTPVHTAIDLNALLKQRGAAAYAVGNGGMAHIYLSGTAEDAAARRQQLNTLRDDLMSWRLGDDLPIERVANQQEAAELGLDNPNSGDLIVFARPGYIFDTGPAAGTEITHASPEYGAHGFLASNASMHGIYLAIGKDVKPGSTSGAVSNVDVAGRVAAWLGIQKPKTSLR